MCFPEAPPKLRGSRKATSSRHSTAAPVLNPWALGAAVAAAQGTGIEIEYRRAASVRSVTLTAKPSDLEASVAGEPRLYGWVYRYAQGIFWILAAAVFAVWIALYMYYRDWRGAFRPTLTATIAAVWGLGFMELTGFSLNPLTLVIPFCITARAVSHSVQMHDRYYEEFATNGFRKRRAILGTFAALFVPTLTAIMIDAAAVLMILLVPIPMLQQIAVTAAFWIFAIAVAELVLNPIVFDIVKAPREAIVYKRSAGRFGGLLRASRTSAQSRRQTCHHCVMGRTGRRIRNPMVEDRHRRSDCGVAAARGRRALQRGAPAHSGEVRWRRALMGRRRGARPRCRKESGNAHAHGAVSTLARARPGRCVDLFHRGHRKVGERAHARARTEVGSHTGGGASRPGELFFLFFSGAAPSETARYVSPDYQVAPITVYARDHKGDTVRRIIGRAEQFIEANPLPNARMRVGGGLIGLLAAANEQLLRNDLLMTALVYAAVFALVLGAYRSFAAAFLLLVPLALSNMLVNAYIGASGMGLNLNMLPVIAVGVGFGLDFGLYLVSRTAEIYDSLGGRYPADERAERLHAALLQAVGTTGTTITFTALAIVLVSLLWWFSEIRFNAEMGLLLGLWMAITWLASLTLLPVLVYVFEPEFVRRMPARTRAVSHRIATANTF